MTISFVQVVIPNSTSSDKTGDDVFVVSFSMPCCVIPFIISSGFLLAVTDAGTVGNCNFSFAIDIAIFRIMVAVVSSDLPMGRGNTVLPSFAVVSTIDDSV